MVIGSPTNFRHDVHLGNDCKNDVSYAFWDSERWRQELLKKNLDIPPLEPNSPSEPSLISTVAKPNAAKRNSITPQKRKPVPSLFPLPIVEPHEVPLPPTPVSSSSPPSVYTHEGSSDPAAFSKSSLPTLEPPSRGPSLDDDFVSLSEKMEQKWEELTYKPHEDEKHSMRTSLFHTDEPTMCIQS
ncbi:hypothetical protein Clacol_002875 [Clathrus columnatus]|uniref:CRIB domain-containing protein n=1 Tax=Clathrus columnatus TaxID=1419009 RepID=A0AAV5A1X1_9AGAM|nr:hypothetical protein Clacol_002875 [Clathrus columnatus]